MKKHLTEIVFILDRSGSMAGLESDTIGGFNAMIEKQKAEDGEALVSTVLFDNISQVIHDRVDIRQIQPMTDKDYYVRGSTALLDAVGSAIHHIGNVHKYAREEDRPEKTLFVITTDGMENASRQYSYVRLKSMIQQKQEQYGWEFLFLGIPTILSRRMGIFNRAYTIERFVYHHLQTKRATYKKGMPNPYNGRNLGSPLPPHPCFLKPECHASTQQNRRAIGTGMFMDASHPQNKVDKNKGDTFCLRISCTGNEGLLLRQRGCKHTASLFRIILIGL